VTAKVYKIKENSSWANNFEIKDQEEQPNKYRKNSNAKSPTANASTVHKAHYSST